MMTMLDCQLAAIVEPFKYKDEKTGQWVEQMPDLAPLNMYQFQAKVKDKYEILFSSDDAVNLLPCALY